LLQPVKENFGAGSETTVLSLRYVCKNTFALILGIQELAKTFGSSLPSWVNIREQFAELNKLDDVSACRFMVKPEATRVFNGCFKMFCK
jgi:hypothetical protein